MCWARRIHTVRGEIPRVMKVRLFELRLMPGSEDGQGDFRLS